MASADANGAGAVDSPGSGCDRGEGTPEPPPPPATNPELKVSPRTPDRASPYLKTGACFTCKQEGHWSSDCPSKKSAGRAAHSGADGGAVEGPECRCGAGLCLKLTSKTEKNPGRKFFRCPGLPRCDFFQWCDSPTPFPLHATSPAKQGLGLGSPAKQQAGNTPPQGDCHPLCQCGAGWCIVLTMKEGDYAGRKYFSCPRKESSGRCDFHRWCDDFSLTGNCVTRPMHQGLASPPCPSPNSRYPDCTCGAGRCRLETMEFGEYAGRKYFACPVKKGQGACNFLQWQNAAEGEYGSGKNHLVGSKDQQHLDQVMAEPRDANRSNMKPTSLNFDNIEVGESYAGLPSSTFERQQGDAEGLSRPNPPAGLSNSSTNASPKLGKCYRCGKEGHWIADCVQPLPSRW